MAILTGTVASVHAGRNADMSKDEHSSISAADEVEVDIYEHPSWLVRSTG